MLSVIIDELTSFLIDNNYTRYPRDIYRPLVPLNLIQFFVRDKDVIVLEIPEEPNNTIIIHEYLNIADLVIDDIKKL